MVYIFHIGNEMVTGYAPLIRATVEMKLAITKVDLCFEQMINKCSREAIDNTLKQIDKAGQYAEAMLDGGKVDNHDFVPLKETYLRQQITDIRDKLSSLRVISLERWMAGDNAGIGTHVRQQYHTILSRLIDSINLIEIELQRKIRVELRSFQVIKLILIGICLSVAVIVGTVFSLLAQRHIRDERILRDMITELALTEDRERKNLAGFLHNDVIQTMVLSKMKLGELRETITSSNQIESLDDIRRQISDMLKSMRSLTLDLCPSVLYDIGLEAALRDWLTRHNNLR